MSDLTNAELGAWVAEELYGWRWRDRTHEPWLEVYATGANLDEEERRYHKTTPDPTLPDTAFRVIEKMRERGWWLELDVWPVSATAKFQPATKASHKSWKEEPMLKRAPFVMDENPALAICKAAHAALAGGSE